MATLNIRSIHHFEVTAADPVRQAVWPELVATRKPLDMDFALSFIERFQATQMRKHPTLEFQSAGQKRRVTGFSTPSAPDDLTRSMVVYSKENRDGDWVPEAMTIGNRLNFLMFYAMTCCDSATASSVIGFQYQGQYEMLCTDAPQGVKTHMHGLFMPGKVRVTRAEASQFDQAALATLKRQPV